MQTGNEHALLARQLFSGVYQGVLSTHSLEHQDYPFGSVVPYTLDREGVPLMLLSHLSQHTKNIDANPHCGLTLMAADQGDVQQNSRLSAIGDVYLVDSSADTERYFNYFPQTRVYHDELGFRFFRFLPIRFHWNAGFATARWFDASRILRTNPFSPEVEQQILGHMNSDHTVALRTYARKVSHPDTQAAVIMVGVDSEGMDLRVDADLFRVTFPHAADTAEEIRTILVEMAEQVH